MQPSPQNQFIQKCAITLTPETSVEFAVQLMNKTNTSYVLILEQSQIVGIFTERELIRAIASGIKLSVATLSDVMAYNVITIKESALGDLFSIIRLLHQYQISYLPVLDEQEQLLGVITNQSIQQALPQELESSVQLAQTQHQHTEEALCESEERLQLALEASGDGLWDWKISTQEVYYSPRWYEMLGYTADELPNKFSTWEKLIHPEDRLWVIEILHSHLWDSSVPYNFEYRMHTKSGEWKWIANYGKVVMRNQNDQPLRMIGIHRDISDRKLAEQVLEEREAFLRAIGDNIPNGYIFQMLQELDGSNRFYYISAGVERTNGLNPEAILADSNLLFNNVVAEDIPYIFQKQQESIQTMSVFDIQLREYSPEGEIRWVRLCSTPRRMDDGRICWEGIRLDITDLKHTEETLLKSKALLIEAQKIAQIGNWEFDLATQKITWTEELFHILNRDPALLEPTYKENLQLYHPEDAEKLHRAAEHSITTGESYKLILRLNTQPHDPPRYVEGIGHTELNADGQVIRLYGTAQNITERFLAEKALQEKEKFLRSIYNGVEQCIFVVDILEDGDFRFVGLNHLAEKLSGLNSMDMQGKSLEDLFPPEMASSIRQNYQACITAKETITYDQACITAKETITYEECLPFKGEDSWWITSLTPLFDEHSQIYRLIGSSIQISDRKQLELALKASETRLKNILTTASASIVSFRVFANSDWEYDYQSIGSENLFGYSAEEIISDKQLWMSRVFPEDRDIVINQLFAEIFAECTTTVEYRFHHKDGSLRWISGTYSSHRDEATDCWIVTGVSVDVSDRKRLELALKTSEKRLKNILATASASIFSFRIFTNLEWEYEYQSTASEIIFGYSAAELLADKMLWLSRVYPEDREKVMYSRFLQSVTEGACSVEYRFHHKDGSLRWISTTYSAHRQEAADGWIVIGVSIDISDRKRAEEALRRSETLFRTLSDSAPIGIFRSNAQGINIYTNPRFQAICGLSFEGSLGDGWMQFIHPEDLAEFLPQLYALTTANQEFCTEVRYIRPDSTLRFCRIMIVPIVSEVNELVGYVGTIEDITESRAIEKWVQ